MLMSYPSAWLLLVLPFLSSCFIRSVPPLLNLAGRRNRMMRVVGVAGLVTMIAALAGAAPPHYGIPLMIAGGLASGFTVFTIAKPDYGDDGWRRFGPPPDDPPPPPDDGEPFDWERFDRVRAQWECQPVAH